GEIRLLADLQFQDGAKPFEDRPPDDPEAKDLLLYLGCNVLRTAHLVSTVTVVLKAMGFDFNAVGGPAYCCGIIHHMNGAREASRGDTAGSVRDFAAYRPQKVLMWCPSCNEHYDDVVKQEHDVTFPYEHVTAFIARHLDRVPFVTPIERRVALHYHTGHPQQDLDWTSARTILRAIPWLEYVEIDNPAALGRHCSSRYINALGRPAWQERVARVAEAAAAAGAAGEPARAWRPCCARAAAPAAPPPRAARSCTSRRSRSRSGAASSVKTSPAPPARIEWTTAAGTVIGRAFGPGSSLTSTWAPLASMTSVSTVHPLIDSSMARPRADPGRPDRRTVMSVGMRS